jgi:hypothetical protein
VVAAVALNFARPLPQMIETGSLGTRSRLHVAYRQFENEPTLNDLVSGPYGEFWDPMKHCTSNQRKGD